MDAAHFRDEGYVIIPGLIDAPRVERLRGLCERILGQWRRRDPQTGEAQSVDATCMRHLNHPAYFTDDRAEFRELMEVIADDRVVGATRALLGVEPLFRCTSLFMNPETSRDDGNWHRDTQFMEPDEAKERAYIAAGKPCAGVQMQIALVPSDDAEYVPRSHLRWDTPDEYAIRRADGGANNRSNAMPGAMRAALRPGDAVVFNASGLHRGRYHADKLRRTLMLTYSRCDDPTFDFFTDQPWFLEPGHLDPLDPPTRAFFERFVAAFRDRWLEKAVVTA